LHNIRQALQKPRKIAEKVDKPWYVDYDVYW